MTVRSSTETSHNPPALPEEKPADTLGDRLQKALNDMRGDSADIDEWSVDDDPKLIIDPETLKKYQEIFAKKAAKQAAVQAANERGRQTGPSIFE